MDRLAGDLRDGVVITVVAQHGQPSRLRALASARNAAMSGSTTFAVRCCEVRAGSGPTTAATSGLRRTRGNALVSI